LKFGFALVAGYCLFSIYSANTVLSSLLPSIGQEYNLSPVILGFIVSVYGWSYASMQIPVGIISDKFEPRIITSLSMLTFFLSTFAFAFSSGGTSFVLSRVLMGLASSFIFVSGLKGIEYVYEERSRGLAVGIFVSISFCGIAIPNLVVSFLPLGSLGEWRAIYLGASVLPLVGSILSFIFFPKKLLFLRASTDTSTGEEKKKRTSEVLRGIRSIIQNRQFMLQNAISFVYFGTFFGVLFWLPSYLESQGAGIILAGLAVFLLGIGSAIGFAISGWLIHKYGNETRNLKFFMMLYTVFVFITILARPQIQYAEAILSFLLGFGTGGSVANTRIVGNLFHKKNAGTVYGIFNMVGWLGSAFYPLIIGYVLSAGYAFDFALLPLGISMLVALILSMFVSQKLSMDARV